MKRTFHAAVLALIAAALVFPAASGAQDQGKEVLKIQLPKPMFVGTPKNIRTANLEPITGKPRGPFMVPVGPLQLLYLLW